LLNQLAASTATFKCIFSPKRLVDAGINADGWGEFFNQRDRILNAINAATGWAVPGGVFWGVGDLHAAFVAANSAGAGTDFISVNPTPCGVSTRHTAPAETETDIEWSSNTIADAGITSPTYAGVIDVEEDHVTLHVVNQNGDRLWSGNVLAGVNTVSYDAVKTS